MKAPLNRFKYLTLIRSFDFDLDDIFLLVERRKCDNHLFSYVKKRREIDSDIYRPFVDFNKDWDVHFLPLVVDGKLLYNWISPQDCNTLSPLRAVFYYNNSTLINQTFSEIYTLKISIERHNPHSILVLK